MRKLWKIAIPYAVLLFLIAAPTALAENDGRGFYGATDDKVVTNFGFALIVFFPVFILLMSLLQGKLERRKEARKAAAKKLSGAPWRGGW